MHVAPLLEHKEKKVLILFMKLNSDLADSSTIFVATILINDTLFQQVLNYKLQADLLKKKFT